MSINCSFFLIKQVFERTTVVTTYFTCVHLSPQMEMEGMHIIKSIYGIVLDCACCFRSPVLCWRAVSSRVSNSSIEAFAAVPWVNPSCMWPTDVVYCSRLSAVTWQSVLRWGWTCVRLRCCRCQWSESCQWSVWSFIDLLIL